MKSDPRQEAFFGYPRATQKDHVMFGVKLLIDGRGRVWKGDEMTVDSFW